MQFPNDVFFAGQMTDDEQEKKDFYTACLEYMFLDIDPMNGAIDGVPAGMFALAKPSIDKIKARSKAGKASAASKANAKAVTCSQQS